MTTDKLKTIMENNRILELQRELEDFKTLQALNENSTPQKTYNVELINEGTINKNKVVIGSLVLWFSYKTCVAFDYRGEFFCIENLWSNTTGKFLNELESDKDKRLPSELFNFKLNQVLGNILK